jgi:hypothetical protein
MIDRFSWRSYDLRTAMPANWQSEILRVSQDAIATTLIPRHSTSREGDPDLRIRVLTVGGVHVRHQLPWLYELYHGLFRDLAQLGTHEPVFPAANDVYGAVLNVQRGLDMRYEAHVDTNPIEGLLYVTSHPSGAGGELVVSNDMHAHSVDEINVDCSVVYPSAGNLIFFDARRFPHYVRPLKSETDIRVVVAMNFYVPSAPESSRPVDLSDHLKGKLKGYSE